MLYNEHLDYDNICSTGFFSNFFSPMGAWVLSKVNGMEHNASGSVAKDFSGNGYDLAGIAFNGDNMYAAGYYNNHMALLNAPNLEYPGVRFEYTGSLTSSFQMLGATSGIALIANHSNSTTNYDFIMGTSGTSNDRPLYSLVLRNMGTQQYLAYRQYNGSTATSVESSAIVPLYTWTVLGFARNSTGTFVSLYMNGIKVYSSAMSAPGMSVGANPKFSIGCHGASTSSFSLLKFKGATQASVLWNKTLTDDQMMYVSRMLMGR